MLVINFYPYVITKTQTAKFVLNLVVVTAKFIPNLVVRGTEYPIKMLHADVVMVVLHVVFLPVLAKFW